MRKKILKGHQGFSLMEILVALLLVSTIFMLVPMSPNMTDREKLEEVIEEFDRAIRFAQNESILRNSIVRININLEKEPAEYSIQYGPSGDLILPTVEDTKFMSLKDRETQTKLQNDLDRQFNNIPEFSEKNKTIKEGVEIIGLASSYLKSVQQEGSLSIYFYPTGDKDESLLYLSTTTELATLKIPAFESTTYDDYYLYSEAELATLSDSQQDKMKELYDKWIKD